MSSVPPETSRLEPGLASQHRPSHQPVGVQLSRRSSCAWRVPLPSWLRGRRRGPLRELRDLETSNSLEHTTDRALRSPSPGRISSSGAAAVHRQGPRLTWPPRLEIRSTRACGAQHERPVTDLLSATLRCAPLTIDYCDEPTRRGVRLTRIAAHKNRAPPIANHGFQRARLQRLSSGPTAARRPPTSVASRTSSATPRTTRATPTTARTTPATRDSRTEAIPPVATMTSAIPARSSAATPNRPNTTKPAGRRSASA